MGDNIRVDVKFNVIDNISKSLQKIQKDVSGLSKTQGVKKFNDNLTRLNKTTAAQSKAFTFLKSRILPLISAYAGFAVVRKATKSFLDFNAAITELKTIVPDAAKINNRFQKSLIDTARQFGTSQAQQAKAFYQIVSAGITDTAKAQGVLIASNKLALGGLANLETTIIAVTKVMSVYGSEAGSAADISDVLFRAVKNGQTRVEDLANALPQVLGLAKSLGVSFRDTAAAVTTLTTRTGSTATAVTQLQAIFSSLLKNQTSAKKILGKNAEAFELNTLRVKGLAKFLKDLKKITGDTTTLQSVLGGRIESLNAVLNFAADGFESLTRNMNEFKTASGDADAAFIQASLSINKQLDFLGANFQRFISGAGIGLQPFFLEFLQGLNLILDQTNEALSEKQTTPLIEANKQLSEIHENLIREEQELESINDSWLGQTGLLDKVKKRIAGHIIGLRQDKQLALDIVNAIKEQNKEQEKKDIAAKETTKTLQQQIEINKGLTDAQKDIVDEYTLQQTILGNQIKLIDAKIRGSSAELAELKKIKAEEKAIRDINKAQSDLILGKLGKRIGLTQAQSEGAVGTISAGGPAIKSKISSGLMQSGNPWAMAAGAVIEIFGKTKEQFESWMNSIADTFGDLPLQIADNIPALVERVIEEVPRFIDAMNEMLPRFIENIAAQLEDPAFVEKLMKSITSSLTMAAGDPGLWVTMVKRIASALVRSIPIFISNLSKALGETFSDIFKFFGNAVDSFSGAVKFFNDIVKTLKDSITGGGGTVGNILSGGLGTVRNVLGFQGGGDVPDIAKFKNDSFGPVNLGAGEGVLERSTNKRIEPLLTAFERGELFGTRTVIVRNVLFEGQQQLSETIVDLADKGFATA